MIYRFLVSFLIGVLDYSFAMAWIGWGDLPPTPKTPGIAWWVNGVGLLFWIISYIALLIKE
ncbi:hypothetical protein EQG49_12730 [Periweissella cryptocerci]|uniref:Uncharacterized protein n=1 Tax=Periweissella cryptocerci TaxID=2506420 RepID=A0A4P6YWV0_9LACO|nr:hypothetical protein [Periweissella cryptocerci]QBO37263.1 hypothetical protein EQG49_12730 [Periweissella cryptocerci]